MTESQKILFFAVLILGTILRFHNYDLYPQRGATSDEYTYSFLGLSLLTKGVPISWSYFGVYKNHQDLTINKLYFPIVWPYFDHPPLNGIVVATWALARGEATFEDITLSTIRLVPIVLTTISSILLFLLLQRLYGYGIALFALLIYSTATIMVVSSRVVLAENLLTMIFIAALLYYERVRKHMSMRQAVTLGVLSGLALWTKELGIVVAVAILGLMIFDKQKAKPVLVVLGVLAAAIVGYITYGFAYEGQVFLEIVATQASRVVGPETLWMLMSRPVLINKIFYDGWYIFGLLALLTCFLDYQKHTRLFLPFFIYFILLIGSLTRHGEMGWYMIVTYPFMAAASGVVLVSAWKRPNGMLLVALLIVGMSLFHYLFELPFGLTVGRFRLFLTLLFVPLLAAYLTKRETLVIKTQRLLLVILLITTAYQTYSYIHPA